MRSRIIEYLNNTLDSDLFGYLIPTGTVMHVCGMLVVMWLMIRRCEKTGLSAYHVLGGCIYGMIGGLIGARIFFILQNPELFVESPLRLLNFGGGTTSWGAYLGGTAAFISYFKYKNLPVLNYLDLLGSALGLGPFFGRLSCFLRGCCYGNLSDLPWAVRYPADTFIFQYQLKSGLLKISDSLSLAVHPVQLYHAAAALLVFMLVSRFWQKYHALAGLTFAFYWWLYALLRFGIEFFRGDVPRIAFVNLTLAQVICVGLIMVIPIIFYHKRRQFLVHQNAGG